jgi:hypothetical protein
MVFFAFACAYSLFDALTEADFFSGKKYEARDGEEVCAEKQVNPDAVLVSPSLFTPSPGILSEFFPSFSSPITLFTEILFALRC